MSIPARITPPAFLASSIALLLTLSSGGPSCCSGFFVFPRRPAAFRARTVATMPDHFSLPLPRIRPARGPPRLAVGGSADGAPDDLVTALELERVERLIVSLSKEPTDEIRRNKLASVFSLELEEATKAGGKPPPEFARLFQVALAKVGDEVQAAAREKALERMAMDENREDEPSEEAADEGEGMMSTGKSDEERQLWALVDMMVQSKTIVKRAMDGPGNQNKPQ